MKIIKKIATFALIIMISVLSALNYKIFVFPNSFAPAGIDGLCTMVQYLTNTNMGYLALLCNIPLLLVGFFFFSLKKDYIIKTALYVVSFSLCTILLDYVDLSSFLYTTASSVVLAPIAGGVIRGMLYAITLKLDATSGGTDVIASMVKQRRPHYNLMNIIFGFNVAVALCAYFVYGFKVEPVICSIIYSFVTSTVTKALQSVGKQQVRFEIITSEGELLCRRLIEELGVSATVVDAHGAYSGADKQMVICVASRETVPKLEKILRDFKGSVVFESTITAAMNVHRIK